MADEAAMLLRKLNVEDANYLCNFNTDTIFGKPLLLQRSEKGN